MTSMCAGSCNLDVILPLPANPLGRSLKDWGYRPQQNRHNKIWEEAKGLGPHRGRDDTALTGSSRVIMRQGGASRTQ